MTSMAQVLVLDNEGGADTPIAKALSVLGFGYVPVDQSDPKRLIEHSHESFQAIIVNSAANHGLNDNSPSLTSVKDCMASLSKLSKAAHIPLILLANSEESASDIGAVATWDDILIGPVSPSHLAGRIAALARLSTMQSELARRFETATRYGVDAPAEVSKPVRVDDAAILVLGKGKYFAAIESNLARHATITGAFTADTALEYLRRRDFDAVLVEVYDSQDEALAFVGDVRRHPRHFNLPILAIGSGLDQSWTSSAFDAGFSEVFAEPELMEEIRQRTLSLVQEGRYRDSLRSVYRKARHMTTSDSLTGLYSRGFLFEHLTTMIDEVGENSDAFSLATFEIRDMAGLNEAYGYATGDRMIRQVGDIMGLLLRGEDLTARYSGARFAAILPDTTPQEAEAAISRILAVIRFTEFSVPEISGPIQVDITSGVAGFQPGDDAKSLVSRSLSWIKR